MFYGDDRIALQINGAKDQFGVINESALHKQLGSFTADDWQAAAFKFHKSSSDDDGFYIEDNKGVVTIHNDVSKAQAVQSPMQRMSDDGKEALKYVAGIGALAGVAAGGIAYVAGGTALGVAEIAAVGAAPGLAIGALAFGATGALEYGVYSSQKRAADKDLAARTLTVRPSP